MISCDVMIEWLRRHHFLFSLLFEQRVFLPQCFHTITILFTVLFISGVFKEEGQLTTCIAYYREAIRLCPEFADAHSNLGGCDDYMVHVVMCV